MVFVRLLRRSRVRDRAHRLYQRLVEQARRPEFYSAYGVPDTLDGRFDMIVLHAHLVLRRLRREGKEGAELGQALFDVMMDDMDRSLREMGVGDLAVGRRVKAMAKAFYGRVTVYDAALAANDGSLRDALDRNLFGTVAAAPDDVRAFTAYVNAAIRTLDDQTEAATLEGAVNFAEPPRRSPMETGNE